jgi:hypothetical protein
MLFKNLAILSGKKNTPVPVPEIQACNVIVYSYLYENLTKLLDFTLWKLHKTLDQRLKQQLGIRVGSGLSLQKNLDPGTGTRILDVETQIVVTIS